MLLLKGLANKTKEQTKETMTLKPLWMTLMDEITGSEEVDGL